MSRWSCTRSLCCRCGPRAWYEIYSREVLSLEHNTRSIQLWGPLGWHHCPALCGSLHPGWVGGELPWGEDPQWGLNTRLDSRIEPIARVAASLEIRRRNLTGYNCLINSNDLLEEAHWSFVLLVLECFTLLPFPSEWGKGCQETLLPELIWM